MASSSSAASISANINSIPMLNGTNFKDWKRNLLIVLGCIDLDHALRNEQPAPLTKESSHDDKREFERWDHSNRMSLMIMKHSILEAFWGVESEGVAMVKNFLEQIEERFAKNDKVEMTTLLGSLMNMKYKGQGNVREYNIMEMHHIVSRLRTLKIELSDDVLVLMVLLTLPPQFNQFKISYNCQKEKWTLNELMSHCVQKEERLKKDKVESAHLATNPKVKGKKRKFENEAAKGQVQKKQHQDSNDFNVCVDCIKGKQTKTKRLGANRD
ncbi:uncharacterized protein LOC133031322 [Cannabis sativa]|uniref:uncharacterized protein LOC133031322 n=1 Tax=Cannabis sativa TaxID=3483 RepID=UPI0029CA0E73|nr:uncharacterized protein LOC133031322 [Cannabis sativa]